LPTYVRAILTCVQTAFISLDPKGSPALEESLSNAMDHLGPMVAQVLIQNLGGNASRSELDKLCDPLKKLVVKHIHAQHWLERALADPSFPSDKVSAAQKSAFLKKIMR